MHAFRFVSTTAIAPFLAAVALVVAPSVHAFPVLVEQTLAQQPSETHLFAGISIGDLVKLPDDNDPTTTQDSVVYYFDRDWKRRPFPNRHVFDSWYADFSSVREVTPEQMAGMRLGPPILYRPGTRLVKIPSIPKVYAVEPGGVLRWITTEDVAIALYGTEWSKRVDDLPEAFFTAYTEGPALYADAYPTRTLLRLGGGASFYVVDGGTIRFVAPQDMARFRFQTRHAVDTTALPEGYPLLGTLTENGENLTDTSQLSRSETLPAAQIDFPVRSTSVEAGANRTLASFRLTVGATVTLRRMDVTLAGAWSDATPLVRGVRLVDRATGETLFGTRELESVGAERETVPFTGAFGIPDDMVVEVDLRADIADGYDGRTLTVLFEQSSAEVVDGLNVDRKMPLLPMRAYPALTVTIGE